MVHSDTHKLDNGDPFPEMKLHLIDGSSLVIPDELMGRWSVLIVYRGRTDEFSRKVLTDFESRYSAFAQSSVRLIAASSEDRAEAEKLTTELNLNFVVAYGLAPRDFSILTGAYYDEKEGAIEPAGFLIDPSGRVGAAVFSSGPIGRLQADETLELIRRIDAARG